MSEQRLAVFKDIHKERERQEAKFPAQVLPMGTGREYITLADFYRRRCETATASGRVTWLDVLLEEVFEAAVEKPGSPNLRKELIETAAVCVRIVEQIDAEGR
jgi:hypothetical protein